MTPDNGTDRRPARFDRRNNPGRRAGDAPRRSWRDRRDLRVVLAIVFTAADAVLAVLAVAGAPLTGWGLAAVLAGNAAAWLAVLL